MTDNIYAPPQASFDTHENNGTNGNLYVVSKKKFYVLYLLTLGIYLVYWMYKNWRLHQLASGEKMIPVMRGIFSIFFTHKLCALVEQKLVAGGKYFRWNPESHATLIVVLLIVSNLCDRLSAKEIGEPFTSAVSLLILIPLALATGKLQAAINLACNDPRGESNQRFTLLNYFWIILGVLFWAMVIYGLTLPNNPT